MLSRPLARCAGSRRQAAPSWTEVFAKPPKFRSRCLQDSVYSDMVFRDKGISEDCLYLNVWTPATSSSAHLPVMVWIYGGGFSAGAASEPRQDGTNLAKKGVVVVSFNYRLGVFGFFSHPELTTNLESWAGNYGLLDQASALQWVKENIAGFGGDPRKVTIFGDPLGRFRQCYGITRCARIIPASHRRERRFFQ